MKIFSQLQIGECLNLMFLWPWHFRLFRIVIVFSWGYKKGCLTVEGNKPYWTRNHDSFWTFFIYCELGSICQTCSNTWQFRKILCNSDATVLLCYILIMMKFSYIFLTHVKLILHLSIASVSTNNCFHLIAKKKKKD